MAEFAFNPITNRIDLTNKGSGDIQSISGTANRITVTAGVNPVIDIAATYVGQASITTLGTIATGTWNGTAIGPTFGGTGLTSTTINRILYSSANNVIGQITTANSGVLTTSSAGVPSIDTTNFAVLTTGVQMKGNNTNTAPPAGFIGERITASASAVATTSGVAKTITSISLTAGVWDVSGLTFSVPTGGTGLIQAVQLGISTTDNTLPAGTAGINFFQQNTNFQGCGGVTGPVRQLLSATTTVYLVITNTYSSTTCPTNGMITATRVG